MNQHVDAIMIGSGQGGVPLATYLADEGKKVVLFERGSWGGSCINYGCTPSKMLLASAHAASAARRAGELGVHAAVTVDFPAVMARIRETTAAWSAGVRDRLDKAGVHLVAAEAAFTGERRVEGGGETFTAPLVVIDTGKSPRELPLPGLETLPYLTYKSIWQLETLPPRTLIIGGGYVGVELGQALACLGSDVHIIDLEERLLSREDAEVSAVLVERLRTDGVTFHFGVQADEVSYDDERFRLSLDNGETVEGEALLIAAGRTPNTASLHLEAAGIELQEAGHIRVDEHFRTTAKGVYAIGDVTGQPAFTHVSWEDYRRLRAILAGKNRTRRDRVLAYAVFTEPQVGRAGLTLSQAEAQGYAAREATMDLAQISRATEVGRTNGFYRMVIDDATDRILGATLVAPTAAELIHVFVAHIEAGSTWQVLDRSVHIHPTFAEGLPSLARKFA